ncbi:MAG: hypothetical protein IT331_16535 [Anaerolineae bacterium]|nr:hypothetical protein [Anaerolineae bacterium]
MKRILTVACLVFGLLAALSFSLSSVNAQSGNPWNLFFYNNTEWTGSPMFSNTASALNFNWNGGSPAPNVPGTNWSLTATTQGFFNGATYQFQAIADDEVLVMIDNQIVIDTRGRNQVGKWQIVQYPLAAGNHNVEVFYRQFGGGSYLQVSWIISKPGPAPQPTAQPTSQPLPYPLAPASATSVTTQFGDYTPCIQKNIHQSNCFVQDGQWNSPNIGSIQMEPQITIWGNCSPADKDTRWTVNANTNPVETRSFRCSKTLAGWFPS